MRGNMPPSPWPGNCETRLDGQPNSRRVEAEARVRLAPLEEVGVAAADVEHGAAAEDVHPVADDGAVGADQRQLAVLGRAAADGGGVAHLVALVLGPAEVGAVVRAEVVIDLADPVPEQVLVEVLGVVQVLLPRRDAGRRRRSATGSTAGSRCAVGSMRFAGMMLPGNGSRVHTPLTSRPVARVVDAICRPCASTRPLKSPRFIASVGTVLNSGAGVPSRYFSPVNMKNVLLPDVAGRTSTGCRAVLIEVVVGLGAVAGVQQERVRVERTCGGRTRSRRRGRCWCRTSATC